MEAGWNSGTCAASHVCAEAEGQKGVNGAGEDGTDRQLALLTSQQRQAFCLVEMEEDIYLDEFRHYLDII